MLPTTSPPARQRKGFSFRTKLIGGLCGLVVVTGVAITGLSQHYARANAGELGESLFKAVSERAVTHARGHVLAAAPVVRSLCNLAGDETLALDDTDRLARQFTAVIKGNPGLSWVSYGDSAGTFTGAQRLADGALRVNQSRIGADGKTRMVEHDVLADGSWREFRRDNDSGYDPRTRPFYTRAVQSSRDGEPVWLDPYVFYNQGEAGVSCAAPVRDAKGDVRGVVSVDFDLRALSTFITTLSVSENSRVFLFTSGQNVLAHPNLRSATASGAGRRTSGQLPTLADTGDPLVDAYRVNLSAARLSNTTKDVFRPFAFRNAGIRYLASATTFHVGDDQVWVVGAVAPESDFFAGVWRSQAIALAAAGVAVLIAVFVAVMLARSVSRPVLSLTRFTRRVGAGDLEAKADLSGGREFRELSGSLNQMIDDLRDRLRLRHSLNLAMEVQQRLLPSRAPTVRGLDVAGHSTYCDETGGDYYDFLMIDQPDGNGNGSKDRLLIALGDVMGHGVAAALVMAGARAVLRDRAIAFGSLAELMSRLNALLAADLDGTRFMTMHLALIDSTAGTYRFVSAGHDPAIIFDPASGEIVEIDEGDLPLGVMSDTTYGEHCYGPLRTGQVILVGTDGIWEMPCATGEQFGKDRLREVIRASSNGTAGDVVNAVLEAVKTFRGDTRPVDDVTFVVIKRVDDSITSASSQA